MTDIYPKPPSILQTINDFNTWPQNVTLRNDFNSHLADYAKYVAQPIYNVKGFGAKGDGVTDDTAAINAAIAAVNYRGGIVFFPVGEYLISSTINLNKQVTLMGVNPGTWQSGSQLKAASAFDPLIHITHDNACLKNLYLKGVGSATAIFVHGNPDTSNPQGFLTGVNLENLVISKFGIGIVFNYAGVCTCKDIRINPGGIKLQTGCNSITFINCYTQNSSSFGFWVLHSHYISFISCAADGHGKYGYQIESESKGISLVACGAEACGFGFAKIVGDNVGVYNCFGNGNGANLDGSNHTVSGVMAQGKNITIIGFNDNNPANVDGRLANIHATDTSQNVVVIGGTLDKGVIRQGVNTVVINAKDYQSNYDNTIKVWETGPTTSRPATPVNGMRFFDTTLGKPIWYYNDAWRDATGATV